jgi:hypothetical protein
MQTTTHITRSTLIGHEAQVRRAGSCVVGSLLDPGFAPAQGGVENASPRGRAPFG